jgi:hypothetical protein
LGVQEGVPLDRPKLDAAVGREDEPTPGADFGEPFGVWAVIAEEIAMEAHIGPRPPKRLDEEPAFEAAIDEEDADLVIRRLRAGPRSAAPPR